MSKIKIKGNNLPPLQKRIILCLAEHGPQTINETTRNISSHYKPTWVAFDSLGRKELIHKVNVKIYRGREYPQFWLTLEGSLVALSNNLKLINAVKQTTFKFCKDNEIEDLKLWYELIEGVGPETARKMIKVSKEGIIDLKYFPIDKTDTEKAIKILKKYPKYWKPIEDKLKEVLT